MTGRLRRDRDVRESSRTSGFVMSKFRGSQLFRGPVSRNTYPVGRTACHVMPARDETQSLLAQLRILVHLWLGAACVPNLVRVTRNGVVMAAQPSPSRNGRATSRGRIYQIRCCNTVHTRHRRFTPPWDIGFVLSVRAESQVHVVQNFGFGVVASGLGTYAFSKTSRTYSQAV